MGSDEVKKKAAVNSETKTEKPEERVSRILEKARQAVKPIVKEEKEGEVVTPDLMGIHFRGTSKR